jgi:hypothetical protein
MALVPKFSIQYTIFEQRIMLWARACENQFKFKDDYPKIDFKRAAQVFRDGIALIAYEEMGNFQKAADLLHLNRSTFQEMYDRIDTTRKENVEWIRNGMLPSQQTNS